MYNLDVEFLDDNGDIKQLTFINVTYLSFRYYNISFLEYKQKNFTLISNVLYFKIFRV